MEHSRRAYVVLLTTMIMWAGVVGQWWVVLGIALVGAVYLAHAAEIAKVEDDFKRRLENMSLDNKGQDERIADALTRLYDLDDKFTKLSDKLALNALKGGR